jgi:hypothetical protein
MKDVVNRLHGEVLLNFDDKKVYIFLIRLQEIDRIVALANQNFIVFTWEKLSEFTVVNCRVFKFERSIQ